jgi:hypothetical protein
MSDELEKLKVEWIIEEKEFDKRKLECLVKRLMPFCKITNSGEIDLTEIGENLSLKEKVMLALVARFIAHRLDDYILEEVSLDEIPGFFSVDNVQVRARLKDLKDEKLAVLVKRGVYKANPIRIEKYLDEIKEKHGGRE